MHASSSAFRLVARSTMTPSRARTTSANVGNAYQSTDTTMNAAAEVVGVDRSVIRHQHAKRSSIGITLKKMAAGHKKRSRWPSALAHVVTTVAALTRPSGVASRWCAHWAERTPSMWKWCANVAARVSAEGSTDTPALYWAAATSLHSLLCMPSWCPMRAATQPPFLFLSVCAALIHMGSMCFCLKSLN